jgi:hypothetical protein
MEWVVRVGSDEYRAQSTEELRGWYLQGRIKPDSYIYHPVLQRWMYPAEVEELRTGATTSIPTVAAVSPAVPPANRNAGGCGKPAVKIVLALGVVLFLLLLLPAFCAGDGVQSEGETIEEKAARGRRERAQRAADTTLQELRALPAGAPAEEIAEKCKAVLELASETATAEDRDRCAKTYLELAKTNLKRDLREARNALTLAGQLGIEPAVVDRLDQQLKPLEEAARKKREREAKAAAAAAGVELRKEYAKVLRTRFLDQGADIKVNVSGKNAQTIKLTFILFNDVWSHRVQKDGLLAEMKTLGFKRVEMSDGYDWGIYWTFDE